MRAEQGSAPVAFVLVAGFLLTPLFLGVVQLGLGLHVRNTLVACASEGARYGANADRTVDDGVDRTRECIRTALRSSYADDVSGGLTSSGLVEITVRAPLPLVAYIGPARALVVKGHAVAEQP